VTSLADWQSSFAGVIDADASDASCLGPMAPIPGPSVEQGCAVYRNNSRGVRAAALMDVYPVCHRLIGDRSFQGLAREFVRRVPSQLGDLNRFGADFCGFLAETVNAHDSFAGLPWLVDLVRLEWLCHSVYYRDDDSPLDLGLLQQGDPSLLCPRPANRLAWMYSPWPVHDIWQAHQRPEDPPALVIDRGDWYLVIEREHYRPRIEGADAALWTLLDACGKGMTLGELGAEVDLDLGLLAELVKREWIGALEPKPRTA
jgi:hypothetical protein